MLEIIYIPGDSLEFKKFIWAQEGKAQLKNIEGHNRWVIKRDDGSEYIARPEEAKPNEESN